MEIREIRNLLFALLIPGLLGIATAASATGWYRPPDQSFTGQCSRAALAAHPGKIERTHVNTTGPGIKVRIYIEQADGQEWIIFCNGITGVIEKSVLVDAL